MAPVWRDLDAMGWRLTSLPRIVFVISKKEKYIWRSFQQHKPAQIEHKRMTPVLCDLDELGWRVTSRPPKIIWLYIRKENRYSVWFNGTNGHKSSTNELRWFRAIWATCGGEWRHTVKKRMFNISNTKPAQTFIFAAQISTNVAQTNGIVLVIIPFYGVPTSRRCFTSLY